MQPKVDIRFNIIGEQIPADHGYLLFSALSRMAPFLHTNEQVAIMPISGRYLHNRQMDISKKSYLTFRVATSMVPDIFQLAGSLISIGDYDVRIGVPSMKPLIPAARLYSRLVVIKGFMKPEEFIEAVHRQLMALEVKGKPMLIWRPENVHSPFVRRTLRVKDKEVVGFALRIENLTAEESMRIQENGIGGRQRFGCGIFMPVGG